jgi:ketosteroid isomerase-like protein
MYLRLVAALVGLCACTPGAERVDHRALAQDVARIERAFAKTLADRDSVAFATFLTDETIFFSGEDAARGKTAIAKQWKPFFDGPNAPFSWEPDHVEVLESGSLALSTGPVRDSEGKVIGRFNSIWRREPSGEWKVVFDKGCPVCAEPAK